MKVLWFSNTPGLFSKKILPHFIGGNWITSLEKEIRKDPNIDLRLAFHSHTKQKKKHIWEGDIYYEIPYYKSNNKLYKLFRNWTSSIQNEDYVIDNYLKVISNFQPDVIQIFGSENPFGLIIDKIKIPVILHIQGNLSVCNYKYYSGFTKSEVKKNNNIKDFLYHNNYYYNKKRFDKEAHRERIILKKCKYIFGRTDWDRRLTVALTNNAKYFHCDEILRDGFYKRSIVNYKLKNDFRIVSVFNDNIWKGLETIFYTAKILINNKTNFTWNICGIDNSSTLIKLFTKQKQHTYQNLNLNFLGPLDEKSVIDTMLNSNLYCHPSHIENSCNAVSEAMMLGLPVLSSSAGGLQTTIIDNQTGHLIQDGDPYVMAGAIIEIKNNYNEAIKLAHNARHVASKRHDKSLICDTVINTYNKITNNIKN